MKNNYRLPFDYTPRTEFEKYVDGHDSLDATIYQPLVYKAAFDIVKKTKAKYLIDIGCGDGGKVAEVRRYSTNCGIILIDHEFIIQNIVKKYDFAEYISADFDLAIPEIDEDILNHAVIICSDVIEHLAKPEILLEFLVRCKKIAKAIIISTPDRVEERGCFDYGPPANPFHVREWTLDEFTRLLMDYGFTNRMLAGLTISNDHTNVKATLLCIISKYLEYESDKEIVIESLSCHEDVFLSNLSAFRKIFNNFRNNKYDDETWYVLNNAAHLFKELVLRISFEDMISLAGANDFNFITKTVLESGSIAELNNKTGDVSLISYREPNPVAAIKGYLINNILENGSFEIKQFPFNILSIKTKQKENFFSFYKKKTFTKISLSRWHENATRKNYVVELAFGGKVK